MNKGPFFLSLITLATLTTPPTISMAAEQEIDVVTVNNNDGNSLLPDTVPASEIMIDWSAWPRNPQEPISSCYLWGPWTAPRQWVACGADDCIDPPEGWDPTAGGYLAPVEFNDIAGRFSNQFKQDGQSNWTLDADGECQNGDDCTGFEYDANANPEGDAPAARLTVCDSDPDNGIPDCGIGPQGHLYTRTARMKGRYRLVCLRESAEGLQTSEARYEFPPAALEVSAQFDTEHPIALVTAVTNFARSISVAGCDAAGLKSFTDLTGQVAESRSFSCPINQREREFTVTASNGLTGPGSTVTKRFKISLAPISLEAPYFDQWTVYPNNYDQDGPGTIQYGYRFSRQAEIDELIPVSNGMVLFSLVTNTEVPWIRGVVVTALPPRRVTAGMPQILVWETVTSPREANKTISVERNISLDRYQTYLIDFDGTTATAGPTPPVTGRHWVWSRWCRIARATGIGFFFCNVGDPDDGHYESTYSRDETRPGLVHRPYPMAEIQPSLVQHSCKGSWHWNDRCQDYNPADWFGHCERSGHWDFEAQEVWVTMTGHHIRSTQTSVTDDGGNLVAEVTSDFGNFLRTFDGNYTNPPSTFHEIIKNRSVSLGGSFQDFEGGWHVLGPVDLTCSDADYGPRPKRHGVSIWGPVIVVDVAACVALGVCIP